MRPDRKLLLAHALAALEGPAPEAARAPCAALLAARADDAEALLVLGLAEGLCGRADDAARLLDRVARARPGHAHPVADLAALLAARGRASEIAGQYRAVLRRDPGNDALRRALARHLLEGGDPTAALGTLGRGDRSAAACHLAGLAEAELGHVPRAIARFRAAVTRDPEPAIGWSNLGMMLKIAGRHTEAIAAHDEAVARAPEDAQLRVNRAVAKLHAGRWAEAWGEYEWRLHLPGHAGLPQARLMPALAEAGDLSGRHILLIHEEGFGDTLHFVRYATLLIARGAAVTMALPAPLRRLLAPIAPMLTPALAPDAALPEHDWHCPFFSLPRVFATTPETVPAPIPYLRPDPALAAAWAARLGPRDERLRVGLVWAGQARPWLAGFTTLDARRSAGLAAFAPVGQIAGLRLIALQAGPPRADPRPPGLMLEDPMGAVADFADTAAILAALDAVVSVDTSVVHLAGAMGVPVLMLDRLDHCWRWLPGRADSPWYPTMRIFRQTRLGDWTEPMRGVAAALADMAGAAGRSAAAPG
ncbi:MAG: tetratricopeptide repeat protein [Rhodospirillales bacterium]|nr:tetratricopeptide repeat protein [Rhodospirillales bacterium]